MFRVWGITVLPFCQDVGDTERKGAVGVPLSPEYQPSDRTRYKSSDERSASQHSYVLFPERPNIGSHIIRVNDDDVK